MKRKPKICKISYPKHIPARYQIRNGRWGSYFYDTQDQTEMDLQQVLTKLELQHLRTRQLRWYVETFGEVK